MISIELQSVVCEEADETYHHGYRQPNPTLVNAGSSTWERVVYLPQLAIVVARHRAGHLVIVPVEHVWHMTTIPGGDDLLAGLEDVFA